MVSRRLLAQTVTARLLAEPAKRQHWLRATAAYLLEAKQTNQLDALMNDIAHEMFVQAGRLSVEVASAEKLSDAVVAEISQYLRTATGATTIDVAPERDASLLGGFVARTADASMDTSVRYKLNRLKGIA